MRHLRLFSALACCAAATFLMVNPRAASAAPVDYVRICSSYAGYFYVPSLNVCMNVLTGETVRVSVPQPFASLPGVTPGEWTRAPASSCRGRLQQIGSFQPGNLTLNSALDVYETPAVPFRLARKEFISSLFISGSFGGPATGFCLAMRDASGHFAVLGCQDLSLLANTPATWRMIPRRSAPPVDAVAPVSFVGGNYDQAWTGPATSGAVKLSACIDKAP